MQGNLLLSFPIILVYRELGRKYSDTKGCMSMDEVERFLKSRTDIVSFEIYTRMDGGVNNG